MTIEPLTTNSMYANAGNPGVLAQLDGSEQAILDVGCGAGDTASLLVRKRPKVRIWGITCSQAEAQTARSAMVDCVCANIETDDFRELAGLSFDVILFSHVLEHLVSPVAAINKFLPFLRPGGKVVIAIPNISFWKLRWEHFRGRFEYTEFGIMDRTHLHFYNSRTAAEYLIDPIPELALERQVVTGGLPLGRLNTSRLGQIKSALDRVACRKWPNLFAWEIILKARKQCE